LRSRQYFVPLRIVTIRSDAGGADNVAAGAWVAGLGVTVGSREARMVVGRVISVRVPWADDKPGAAAAVFAISVPAEADVAGRTATSSPRRQATPVAVSTIAIAATAASRTATGV
jgi:hypothetical protein